MKITLFELLPLGLLMHKCATLEGCVANRGDKKAKKIIQIGVPSFCTYFKL